MGGDFMQLKIKRSQKSTMLMGKAIFCLDVRAEYSESEWGDITRYNLHKEPVYSSAAARRRFEASEAARDGTMAGGLDAFGHALLGAMNLNITVESLGRGHHIECKSLEEMVACENALIESCKSVREFLDIAATFDGREMVIDFSEERTLIVAETAPAPKAAALPPPAPLPPPEPVAQMEVSSSGEAMLFAAPKPAKTGAIQASDWTFLALVMGGATIAVIILFFVIIKLG
jgi:hypothetical protein